MNEEKKSQKEEFLLEVQKQILHKGLKSEIQEDGRLHVKWNNQPLCEVDEYGRAWCRPVSVTCPEMKKSLRAVSKTASQVWEYMQIFARAPALKANGVDGSYNRRGQRKRRGHLHDDRRQCQRQRRDRRIGRHDPD